MTPTEFDEFRRRAIKEYAAEHIRAGDWNADVAEELAAKETDALLPQGVDSPGMLLLVAETDAAEVVGIVWVALERADNAGAWIFDIEVDPAHRGQGYGRALLRAAESEVRQRGGKSIGLNVFGANTAARRLYESSGYEIASLHMRKLLTPTDDA
jgi:ribosomal protein S18 acetylase RimI-like enzyme